MYLAHIQRHTTQGRRGTSAGRRARPLQHHRAPRRCTGVDGTSSCLTGSLSLAKPRGGDVVGDKRQRLLVSFDSTRPSDSVGCARRAACRDERVRHLPAREGMPQLHGEDRLGWADVPEAQEPQDRDESSPLPPRRCRSASARFWGCRTARSLCCSAASTWRGHAHGCWPCPRHKNDVGRAARFGTSDALNSRRRN